MAFNQNQKKKIVYPTTKLTIWGLEFDNVCFQVRLPQDKLDNLKSDIEKFQNKKSSTLRELQSLIGMLNFACNVVPYSRIFLSRLINLTAGLKMPYHHRKLNLEASADLKAWDVFLKHFNDIAFYPLAITHSSSFLHLFTETSNLSFGGTIGKKWIAYHFTPDWLQYTISVRWFLPIVIALEIWGSTLKKTLLLCFTQITLQQVKLSTKIYQRIPNLCK